MAKRAVPQASDRTIDIFTGKTKAEVTAAAVEDVNDTHEDWVRTPMEEDVDRNRDQAFKTQEWSTNAFGRPDAKGNQHRLSHRGEHYYLETLTHRPEGGHASSYHGHMFHERDLYDIANCFYLAAKAKKETEK